MPLTQSVTDEPVTSSSKVFGAHNPDRLTYWNSFWSYSFLPNVNTQGIQSERVKRANELAKLNKFMTFMSAMNWGVFVGIFTYKLQELNAYDTTVMSEFINIPSSSLNIVVNANLATCAGTFVPLIPSMLGTNLFWKYDHPRCGAAIGHIIGQASIIAGITHLLFPHGDQTVNHINPPMPKSCSEINASFFDHSRKPLNYGGYGASWTETSAFVLPTVNELADTATYAGVASIVASLSKHILKDLIGAYKKDAADKSEGKPAEECSAVADHLFFLANMSLTLLPIVFSNNAAIDLQTRLMAMTMMAAISFVAQLANKSSPFINGVLAGYVPAGVKMLENLIASNQSLMKDTILLFASLIISAGGAILVENIYQPGKALLVNGIGSFARSFNNGRTVSVPAQSLPQRSEATNTFCP